MIKRIPMIGPAVVCTLASFASPAVENAKPHEPKPTEQAEMKKPRPQGALLPDGPESENRFVQTVRGDERLATTTSTEDVDLTSGTHRGMIWWVQPKFK